MGEIEEEGKVLAVKRIKMYYTLAADESQREIIERVLGVYADNCPLGRTVKGCVEVTSEVRLGEIGSS